MSTWEPEQAPRDTGCLGFAIAAFVAILVVTFIAVHAGLRYW